MVAINAGPGPSVPPYRHGVEGLGVAPLDRRRKVAVDAKACPQCGAPRRRRTRLSTWIIGGAIAASLFAVIGRLGGGTASGCPPIRLSTLTLPPDKVEASEDFTAKAQRLNDAGKCVIEGSYGRSSQKFYVAVQGKNDPKPYHLRYTREELRK